MERVDAVEEDGVDTERSRTGTASRASEGDTLGDGELGRRSGEVALLVGGLLFISAAATAQTVAQTGVQSSFGRLPFEQLLSNSNLNLQTHVVDARKSVCCCRPDVECENCSKGA